MNKTVVINVVGLAPRLLGEHTPALAALARRGRMVSIRPMIPAVTCAVQTTYLTGAPPAAHGIVGNGWYFRDECEVRFWRQSNRLVQCPSIWDRARAAAPGCTAANLFWWYNMYSGADFTVTPRPMYPADGRKIPDIYAKPAVLRARLQQKLGRFPLFKFWGPGTSIVSSRWIADAAMAVDGWHDPTLTLIYLPHLDYCLQRVGPRDASVGRDLEEIDAVVADLVAYYESRGARLIVLSEYGIVPVDLPVHINRHLRTRDWIAIREERGRELLDAGECEAFAVSDHQVAHIYVRRASLRDEVRKFVAGLPGVARVLDGGGKRLHGLDHPRSGDLVALAEANAWFTYYYWLEDARAPDFARTVDIHRKPGYDPAELFLDPADPLVKARIGLALLKKKLGFRYLMEAIPLDATLVRGSHGTLTAPEDSPVLIANGPDLASGDALDATAVHDVILKSLVG